MVKYLLLCFILLACLFHEGKSCFLFTKKTHVSVVNTLEPKSGSITVHCKSKDDDLGYHTLAVNQDFHFDFCVKPFSTLFTCDIWWDKWVASFQAYNAKWLFLPCAGGNNCVYEVRESGIYLPGGTHWVLWDCAEGKVCN
ncbi:hypothetical protein ACP275_06G172800 [Erythranthe tilingii]